MSQIKVHSVFRLLKYTNKQPIENTLLELNKTQEEWEDFAKKTSEDVTAFLDKVKETNRDETA